MSLVSLEIWLSLSLSLLFVLSLLVEDALSMTAVELLVSLGSLMLFCAAALMSLMILFVGIFSGTLVLREEFVDERLPAMLDLLERALRDFRRSEDRGGWLLLVIGMCGDTARRRDIEEAEVDADVASLDERAALHR